jgi:uncharacterized ferritin-like protein (DUF455 family)
MRIELAHQMWDEARHIEIVAKACEEELGAKLGYGPWPLSWWWMQNEMDPMRRISVTNSWAEANLMNTLRQWRIQAEKRGYQRIAELCDYLQADELTHVKLATTWIRRLTDDKADYREGLLDWSKQAVKRIESFYDSAWGAPAEREEPHFTFVKGGMPVNPPTSIIGE